MSDFDGGTVIARHPGTFAVAATAVDGRGLALWPWFHERFEVAVFGLWARAERFAWVRTGAMARAC